MDVLKIRTDRSVPLTTYILHPLSSISNQYRELNSMLYRFIGSVELQHDTSRVGNIEH